MYLVTAQQMKSAEDAANQSGLSYDAMMEHAGKAVAEAIDGEFGAAGKQMVVLVGPGNNGGDGLVAARYLADLGAAVSIYLWKRSDLAEDVNWQRLADYALEVFKTEDDPEGHHLAACLDKSAIVIDALLGTGVSRPITGSLADLLTQARAIIDERRMVEPPTLVDPIDPPEVAEYGPAIVAVDLPSGLHTDTGALDPLTLPADVTVTFAAPKKGHVLFPGAAYIGQLLIADIGIDPDFFPTDLPKLATPDQIADILPERHSSGHKGTFGSVLVASGCANYTGAPALSATAAYRSGAGLVTVAVPASIQAIVAANLTEATYLPLPHKDGAIAEAAAGLLWQSRGRYKALLVGPGLGTASATGLFLERLLAIFAEATDAELPLILDADALNLLAKQPEWWTQVPPQTILTPHPGEMSRLSDTSIAEIEARRLEFVPEMAQKWNQVVVYKGAYTVVAGPAGEVMVMPFANPALATAGSGDVLAGSIAGLLAHGLSPFEAAVGGAYLHGLAGEIARDKFGEAGVMAGDLPPLLPLALKELRV